MPLTFQLKFHNKEPRFDYSAVEYFSCRLCRHVNWAPVLHFKAFLGNSMDKLRHTRYVAYLSVTYRDCYPFLDHTSLCGSI